MEKILNIETPIGSGYITFGEFMPCDARRKNKYSCWWNGCGIGGTASTLKESKAYLFKYIEQLLKREVETLEEKSADIRLFLRQLKKLEG